MSSLPLVGLGLYGGANPRNISEMADRFVKYRAAYQAFNFATPLIALMVEAGKKSAVSGEAKKAWVLSIHEELVELAYPKDPLRKQIALDSAPSLVEALFCIGDGSSLFVKDTMAFNKYYDPDIEKLLHSNAQFSHPKLQGRDYNCCPCM